MKTRITVTTGYVAKVIELEGDFEEVMSALEAMGQLESDVEYVPENNTVH